MATNITENIPDNRIVKHPEHLTPEHNTAKCKLPFMRYQMIEVRERQLSMPICQRDLSVGFYLTEGKFKVFHLLGFGETLEAAEKMAGLL